MRFFILFAILCSMVAAKYSYTDKCYCYEGRDGQYSRHVGLHSSKVVINDQYYVNKRAVPIGRDRIIYAGRFDAHLPPTISVYHQYGNFDSSSNSNVFSHCTRLGDRYNCTNVCESIWFKIWANLDDEKLSDCAKEFKGQYGDVT